MLKPHEQCLSPTIPEPLNQPDDALGHLLRGTHFFEVLKQTLITACWIIIREAVEHAFMERRSRTARASNQDLCQALGGREFKLRFHSIGHNDVTGTVPT
jgi:hypothetical protein